MSEQHTAGMMDALVWTGPHQMVLRGEPVPQPAPGEVLLEVDAVGICGSELSAYLGENSLRRPPLIMGHEAAGRVAITTNAPFADGQIHDASTRVTFNPLVICGQCDRCTSGHANLCRTRQQRLWWCVHLTSGSLELPRNLVREFKALLRRAAVPPIRFHDLRHSCASMLVVNGVPARVAMEVLGHANITTRTAFRSTLR